MVYWVDKAADAVLLKVRFDQPSASSIPCSPYEVTGTGAVGIQSADIERAAVVPPFPTFFGKPLVAYGTS